MKRWLVLALSLAAGTAAAQPAGVVSITFDDGKPTVFANAFPLLAARKMPATMYVITQDLGAGDWHINLEQVAILRGYGWEIGSHTHTHPDLTKVTSAQLREELEQSRQVLWTNGIQAHSFASPFGLADEKVLRAVRSTYRSHRFAWGGGKAEEEGLNPRSGFDPYRIAALEVTREMPLAQVSAALDRAAKERKWLVLLFHHVTDGPLEHRTQISTALFRDIVAEIAKRAPHLEVRTLGAHVEAAR